jgi:hypothetical protein
MTHTTRTTRSILIAIAGLALNAGFLILLYRDDTEAGSGYAAVLLLTVAIGLIAERLERRRPPLGTVATTTTFGLACHAYIVGVLINATVVTSAAFLVAYAAFPTTAILLYRLLAHRR